MTGTFMITRRSRLRDGNTDTQTHREEDHVTREEEDRAVELQARNAKDCPRPPEATERQGRLLPFQGLQREHSAADTIF